MKDTTLNGILLFLIVVAIWIFGFGVSVWHIEGYIVKEKVIYIKNQGYKCSKVNP